jgi:hypothetical protein
MMVSVFFFPLSAAVWVVLLIAFSLQCFAVTLSPVNFSTASLALLAEEKKRKRIELVGALFEVKRCERRGGEFGGKSGAEGVKDLHIAQGDHADGLPDAEADSGSHSTVKAFDAVLRVDVFQCLADGQIFWSVGVFGFALHFYPDHLDGLIPRAESATQATGKDLLHRAQLLTFFFASSPSDRRLCQSRQAEAGAPIGGLSDCYGVDASVDTLDAFFAVDAHEGLYGTGWLHTRSSQLMLGYFNRLHARAEAHGRIGLSDTADHASADTAHKVGRAKGLGVVLCL